MAEAGVERGVLGAEGFVVEVEAAMLLVLKEELTRYREES